MNIPFGRPGSAPCSTRNPGRRSALNCLATFLVAATPLRGAVVDSALVARLSEELRTGHPALRALERRADAAGYQAEGVRQWADPQFQVGGEVSREGDAMARTRGDLIYGLQQRLPVLGKEQAARSVAEAAAATAATRVETRFQELRRDLAVALLETAFAGEMVALDQEDLAWLSALESATAARVASGAVPGPTLLRLRNEAARRSADLTNSLAVLDMRRAGVNRLLGRDELRTLEPLELPDITPAVPYSPAVVVLALNAEPELQIVRRQRTEAERVLELTRRQSRPDLAIGVQGRQYSGDAGFREGMFTLSLNLPWLNRAAYRRDILRDESRLQATDLDRADLELMVREEVHHLTVRIANAERDARLYRDGILPRTRTQAEATEALWTSGRAGLDDVLAVRRELVGVRRLLARSVADEWVALSELLLCCGLDDLESLQAAGPAMAGTPVPAP